MSSLNNPVGDKISLNWRSFKFPLLGVLTLFTCRCFDTVTICNFYLSLSVIMVCCSAMWTNPSCFGVIGLVLVIHAWQVENFPFIQGLLGHSISLSLAVAFWLHTQIAASGLTAFFVVSSDIDVHCGFWGGEPLWHTGHINFCEFKTGQVVGWNRACYIRAVSNTLCCFVPAKNILPQYQTELGLCHVSECTSALKSPQNLQKWVSLGSTVSQWCWLGVTLWHTNSMFSFMPQTTVIVLFSRL